MHAGEHDHFGIDVLRLPGQLQTVADDVGHAVEDLGRLVVMRENDGIALALELQDGVDVVSEHRPFHGGDHPLNALIERCGAGENVVHDVNLILSIRGSARCREGSPMVVSLCC